MTQEKQLIPRLSWRRALALAAGAVYGPQLLMGLVTLGVVNCNHCRATVWELMAVAPGVEMAMTPLLLSEHALSPLGDMAKLVIATVLSLAALVGMASSLRRPGCRRWILFSMAFLLFSAGAFLLLAMIRT